MRVGYIRVSSVDQNDSRQLDGMEFDRVYREKVSGRKREREQLDICIDFMRDGDHLFVHEISRLARNQRDFQNIVHELLNKGVSITFVKENITVDAKPSPMRDMMLSVMAGSAQLEVDLIRERQAEGIAKAKERGQQMGRLPLSKKLRREIHNRADSGQKKIDIARSMNIGQSTVYKWLREPKP